MYARKVVKANKVHKCTGCGDPICKDEFYTSFTDFSRYTPIQGPKCCESCEPIIRHEGRVITKDLLRDMKSMHPAYTWNYVAMQVGFESYDDFKAYMDDCKPVYLTKS